jgi:nitrogen regulatory protein PII-like uncharacterized protein
LSRLLNERDTSIYSNGGPGQSGFWRRGLQMLVIDSWETFFTTVEAMRTAQKKFFRGHSKAVMAESILIEEVVDKFIKERNERKAKKAQPTMFEEGK